MQRFGAGAPGAVWKAGKQRAARRIRSRGTRLQGSRGPRPPPPGCLSRTLAVGVGAPPADCAGRPQRSSRRVFPGPRPGRATLRKLRTQDAHVHARGGDDDDDEDQQPARPRHRLNGVATPVTAELLHGLRDQRVGVLLSLLAVLSGFVLGGVFATWEPELREGLHRSGEAVLAERYGGSAQALDTAVDGAWGCYRRAHEHWAGIGAATLAVSLLLAGAMGARASARWVSLALGIGALGYPCFWLLAGRAAPRLGGVAQAAASLRWLGAPTSGLLVLGAAGALVLISARLFAAARD